MPHEVRSVTFKNGAIDIAGELRVPHDHDRRRGCAALVIATPGSSVKEQIGAAYAERLTACGSPPL